MEENKSSFRASPQTWHALVEELASSGMSAAEFCRRRAIPVWQMRYWLKKVKDDASAPRGFVEIGRNEFDPAEGLWVEAGRFKIRIGHEFDAALLRRVAEALA
jgi:hypothetical protein